MRTELVSRRVVAAAVVAGLFLVPKLARAAELPGEGTFASVGSSATICTTSTVLVALGIVAGAVYGSYTTTTKKEPKEEEVKKAERDELGRAVKAYLASNQLQMRQDLAVGAGRRCHSRQADRHVLQQLQPALAIIPLRRRQRHQANVESAQLLQGARQRAGYKIPFQFVQPVRWGCSDKVQVQTLSQPGCQNIQGRAQGFKVGGMRRDADPSQHQSVARVLGPGGGWAIIFMIHHSRDFAHRRVEAPGIFRQGRVSGSHSVRLAQHAPQSWLPPGLQVDGIVKIVDQPRVEAHERLQNPGWE